VECVAGVMLGTLALVTQDLLPLVAYAWLAAVGLALTVVDLAAHRLPNHLTGSLVLGVAAILTLNAATGRAWQSLAEATACGVAAGSFYLVLSIAARGGVGFGDAKLAVGVALAAGWTGWRTAVFAVILGFLLTGIVAIALVVFSGARRGDTIPHAPFMLSAALTAIILANA
jgi:leader peptidase (prepilin peptidase) / N-methyltransferase